MTLSNIKAFLFDVDGVLTDGGLLADLNGEFYRTFDSKDGFGLRMAIMQEYAFIISAEYGFMIAAERPLESAMAKNVPLTASRFGSPNDTLDTPSEV